MVKKKKDKKKGRDDNATTTTDWELESISSQTSATEGSTLATDTEDEGDKDLQGKNSSEQLDERTDIDKELFDLVGVGDRHLVEKYIASHRTQINVSHRDMDGDDILSYAVNLGDEKMVEMIIEIDPGHVDTYSGLISAIKENKVDIVLALLAFEDIRHGGAFYSTSKKLITATSDKRRKKQLKDLSTPEVVRDLDQKKYGHDVTPLMVAAMNGCYEIMQVLYDRGERLPRFHLPSCNCYQCKGEPRTLEKSLKRVELLKAMANPIYLIFMASQDGAFDPVYETFLLSEILDQCAEEEPGFNKEYEEIKVKVEALPASLIDLCRTTEELKIMLAQRQGYTGPASDPYPRLGLAIDMAQKRFVIQPCIEFFIHNTWIGHPWHAHTIQEKIIKYVFLSAMLVLFPVFQILLWLTMFCCSELPTIRFLLSPVNRSLSKLASHIAFFALLLWMNQEERAEADVEPPTIYIRWMVVLYVISHFFALLRRFLVNPTKFWKHGWNKWDIICQLLFWSSFGIWIQLFIRQAEMAFEDYLPRRQLDSADPLLIGECLFALASTFSSLKIMRWYILTNHVGPIQSAMARLWKVLFVALIFIFLASMIYVISARIIYRPFKNETKLDEDKGKMVEQDMDMTDWEYMFLTFLGLSELPPEKIELFPHKEPFINDKGEESTVSNDPVVAQAFIYGMCLVFNVVIKAFLQPAIIGIFTSHQEDMTGNREEWRYLLVQEWLYHINDTYLTPPFNLLPTGSCIMDLFTTLKAFSGSRKRGKRSSRDVESSDNSYEEQARAEYPFLLRKLFVRFFQESAKLQGEKEQASVSDVSDIQHSVKEVKELSMDIVGIKRSGSLHRRGSRTLAQPYPTMIVNTHKTKS